MKTYIWFRSNVESVAYRCNELVRKAFGGILAYVRDDLSQSPTPPAQWGTPVGAGPDAGSNQGAAIIESVRASVLAGTNPNLTPEEYTELTAYLNAAEALENTWWCEPVEEEEGAL